MRFVSILVLAALCLAPAVSLAGDGDLVREHQPPGASDGASANTGDARIRQQLDQLGYGYTVDEDGDYKLTFELDDDRSQLVFVISNVERYGAHLIREIWAPAYRAPSDAFSSVVANKLLEDSNENKMGAWVKQDDMAVYVVKIAADASNEELDDAMEYALTVADRMEVLLTDGADEF